MGEAGCRCFLVMTRPVERPGGPVTARRHPSWPSGGPPSGPCSLLPDADVVDKEFAGEAFGGGKAFPDEHLVVDPDVQWERNSFPTMGDA